MTLYLMHSACGEHLTGNVDYTNLFGLGMPLFPFPI